MITPAQAKEICERHAVTERVRLFWITDMRCKVYRRRMELGELLCSRPYLPIGSKGFEPGLLREAVLAEVWERFPSERAA